MNRNEVVLSKIAQVQKQVTKALAGGLVVGFWGDCVVVKKKAIGMLDKKWSVRSIKNGSSVFTWEAVIVYDSVTFKAFLTDEDYEEVFGNRSS